MIDKTKELNERFKTETPEDVLRFFLQEYKGNVAFATSLGAEDQVIIEMISRIDPSAYVFTLDTGRMFQETYDLLDITEQKYKVPIKTFFPDAKAVEEMVSNKGINLFYKSVENRQLCCHIRKIEPMQRALKDMKVWISGLRKEQSITRTSVELVEWDNTNQMIKINPLFNWTEKQVWDQIRKLHIPYNILHDKGFPSIGCLPCTRAVEPGEDIRSGRWWWELAENKECGLNVK